MLAIYAGLMPRFEITITETIRSIEVPAPANFTAEARTLTLVVEASDQDAATELAYLAWDEKYGPGKRPEPALLKLTPLDG